jgi:hypothetical protein
MKINKLSIIFIVLFLGSCQFSRKESIKKIIQEWQGKEILIPSDISFKSLGRDTASYYLWNNPYKIFTYIDSIGCSSCQLGLYEWKLLIDSCRLQPIDIGFIFAVHSSDFKRFNEEVRLDNFDYPIIYDEHNYFEKLNKFPSAPYRTFLLDKDNKVILIGSPINNPQLWELYKNVITQP